MCWHHTCRKQSYTESSFQKEALHYKDCIETGELQCDAGAKGKPAISTLTWLDDEGLTLPAIKERSEALAEWNSTIQAAKSEASLENRQNISISQSPISIMVAKRPEVRESC